LTLRVFRQAVAAMGVAGALAACSNGESTAPPTRSTAADALSRISATAAAATYSASYSFFEATDNQTATVQVWRNPPSLRVDVTAHGTTATLIVGDAATYSCSMTSAHRACLLVAKAGEPLPAPFNVAPANLFSVYVRQLATRTGDYVVSASAPPSPTTAAPLTTGDVSCFAVTPKAQAAQPQVPAGTYCFFRDGVLASVRYPSGNTVSLQSRQAATPPATQFSPYAKPTPLPS